MTEQFHNYFLPVGIQIIDLF